MDWIEILLLFLIPLVLVTIFNVIMRKYLKVEKIKGNPFNHVNKMHEKNDWIIIISFIIVILTIPLYMPKNSVLERKELLSIIVIAYFIITEITRVFMEWKYAKNRKVYIFTISKLVFLSIVIGIELFIIYRFQGVIQ